MARKYGRDLTSPRMRGLNKVTLIGNFGKDPEVQVLEGNVPVAKFSLATSETWRDKGGQPHTSTDWHTVVRWRGLAELAQSYLRKGSLVYLKGKLRIRRYEDAAGGRYHTTEGIGEQLLLDKENRRCTAAGLLKAGVALRLTDDRTRFRVFFPPPILL